jgi:uracil-DNA glycosylase
LGIDKVQLPDVIGKEFFIRPFGTGANIVKVIPLPHPSGLNTWVFNPTNKILLDKALNLIKESLQK